MKAIILGTVLAIFFGFRLVFEPAILLSDFIGFMMGYVLAGVGAWYHTRLEVPVNKIWFGAGEVFEQSPGDWRFVVLDDYRQEITSSVGYNTRMEAWMAQLNFVTEPQNYHAFI